MENVVIKATAKDINNRYADVEEMMTDVATSTSLDRRGEEKLVFNKDHDETKIMPANLINPYDTKPLIDKKTDDQEKRNQNHQLQKTIRIKIKNLKRIDYQSCCSPSCHWWWSLCMGCFYTDKC